MKDKPEIKAFLMQQDGGEPYVSLSRDSNCNGVIHPLIKLSDYEALQERYELLQSHADNLLNSLDYLSGLIWED